MVNPVEDKRKVKMGDIKHIGTFLRSTLVKDPFCLGDFLEPKDVLRIEAEFPEFFKPIPMKVATPISSTKASLNYTKPASGSPYKTPLIPKKHGRPPILATTTKRVPAPHFFQKKTFQGLPPKESMCSRGLRCLPQFTSQHGPVRASTMTPHTRPPTTFSSTSCGTQTQHPVSALKKNPVVRFSTSIAEKPSGSQKTPAAQRNNASLVPGSNIWHLMSSPQIQQKTNSGQQTRNIGTDSERCIEVPRHKFRNPMKHEIEKHSPSRPSSEPAQNVVMQPITNVSPLKNESLKKKKPLPPAPGFIRPIFSTSSFYNRKSRSRSLPIPPSSQRIEIEDNCGTSTNSRKEIAKYEEIFENEEEEPVFLEIFTARKRPTPTASSKDTFKEMHQKSDDRRQFYVLEEESEDVLLPSPSTIVMNKAQTRDAKPFMTIGQEMIKETKDGSTTIPSLEQLFFAELLASKYEEYGKFGKQPKIDKNSSHAIERETLQSHEMPSETVEMKQQPGNEVNCKITPSHKRILEKLARELIRSELQQCLLRSDESNNEKLDFAVIGTQTDTPPKSTAETLQFYRDGVKKMIDVGIGTNSRSKAEVPSKGSSHTTINSLSLNDIYEDSDKHHVNSKLINANGNLAQSESDEGDKEFHSEIVTLLSSSSKSVILEIPSRGGNKVCSPETQCLNEMEVTMETEDSPLNFAKEFNKLSTILEEAINIPPSGSLPLTDNSPSFRSNLKHVEPRSEKYQNSPPKPMLRPHLLLHETNDVTDCSSISDFILSENKQQLKAIDNTFDLDPSMDSEKSMSLFSKVQKFIATQNAPSVPLPAGLEQSISLLRVSIPETENTDISGSASSATVSKPVSSISKDSSISENREMKTEYSETTSTSESKESYQQVYTTLLSHGELLSSHKKSIGEISWAVAHSPGFCSVTRGSEEFSSNDSEDMTTMNDFGESADDEASYSLGQKSED